MVRAGGARLSTTPAGRPVVHTPGRRSWSLDGGAGQGVGVDSDVPFVTRVALAVRAGRHGRGMSQRAFAVAAGMSQSRVARLETGKSCVQVADLQMVFAIVGLHMEIVHADGEGWTLESALDFDAAGIVDR